jgi:hypothetical protein
MPCWSLHRALAVEFFGISGEIADSINRMVDVTDIHDLGRRMPKEPRIAEQIFDPEEACRRIVMREKMRLKMRVLLSRGPEWSKAFLLHHALDLLALRLIAANLTGVPLEAYEKNLLEGVCTDLRPLFREFPDLKRFLPEFRLKFGSIASHQKLARWTGMAAERMRAEESKDAGTYLQPYFERALQRMAKKEGGGMIALPSPWVPSAMSEALREAQSKMREYMGLIYRVSFFAARRSRLLYYALLLPFPLNLISEIVLRVTRRRAAGLGREALSICQTFEDRAQCREAIIKAVHKWTEEWLPRYNVKLPQECAEEYADFFMAGYGAVSSVWENLGSNEDPRAGVF